MDASLARYYEALPQEGGLASRCHMALEGVDWAGKRVLDVACRRGKGAFKLSDCVGSAGYVVGVDWREAFVAEARAAAPAALERSGLAVGNLDFRVAYPEDLASAGVADASFDVVYINNGFVLFADPAQALRESARALVPGGLLVLEVSVAPSAPSAAALAAARAAGDSAGAARTWRQFERWLAEAGFSVARTAETSPGLLVVHGRRDGVSEKTV